MHVARDVTMPRAINLSDKDIMLLISGLLCRVNHGHTTGEDHAELLQDPKHRAGITW